jgi:uncharacterized protein (DUF736 family)
MATIGSFTRTASGYTRTLKTLTLEVKLDDPAFPARVHARLVEVEGEEDGFALIWSRRSAD